MSGLDCKVYVFTFRPSSHSDDFTIIATYKDSKKAEKVKKALEKLLRDMDKNKDEYVVDWNPDEANVSLDGNKVWFEVYTAGYLDDIESVIRKVAKPNNIEYYKRYQEITVRVKIPKDLTIETAMLVLDREEAEAIRWLREKCGEPKVEDCGDGTQVLEWFYNGDEIYYDGTLYAGFEFYIGDRDNWDVS